MPHTNDRYSNDDSKPTISLHKSDVDPEVIKKLVSMSLDGSIESAGLVEEFEFELLESVGRKKADGHFAIATGDISIAYQLAFSMLAIQAGDEVVMPAFQRNRAVIEAVEAVGAIPVLVDIDEATIGINPAEAEAAITERTRGIIAIDHEMTVCDHEALRRLAAKSKIEVIHDISTSYGTAYKGKPVGNQHDLTIMSCTPLDSLNCVEGAALLGRGIELLRSVENARRITLKPPMASEEIDDSQIDIDAESVGISYKMSAFHAGIGTSQIKRINNLGATEPSAAELPAEEKEENETGAYTTQKRRRFSSLLCIKLKTRSHKDRALELAHSLSLESYAPWSLHGETTVVPKSATIGDTMLYLPARPEAKEQTERLIQQLTQESLL